MGAEPEEAVEWGGMLAARDIRRGEVLASEPPLAAWQLSGNRGLVPSCCQCGAFVGSLSVHARTAEGAPRLAALDGDSGGGPQLPEVSPRYLIRNRASGLVLEVPGGAAEEGARLVQWAHDNDPWQYWVWEGNLLRNAHTLWYCTVSGEGVTTTPQKAKACEWDRRGGALVQRSTGRVLQAVERRNGGGATLGARSEQPSEDQLWEEEKAGAASSSAVVRCPQGCGELFCGPACARKGMQGSHGLLCVGPLWEQHPLYRFKLAAIEEGEGVDAIVFVAAQLVAEAVAAAIRCSAVLQLRAGGVPLRLSAGAGAVSACWGQPESVQQVQQLRYDPSTRWLTDERGLGVRLQEPGRYVTAAAVAAIAERSGVRHDIDAGAAEGGPSDVASGLNAVLSGLGGGRDDPGECLVEDPEAMWELLRQGLSQVTHGALDSLDGLEPGYFRRLLARISHGCTSCDVPGPLKVYAGALACAPAAVRDEALPLLRPAVAAMREASEAEVPPARNAVDEAVLASKLLPDWEGIVLPSLKLRAVPHSCAPVCELRHPTLSTVQLVSLRSCAAGEAVTIAHVPVDDDLQEREEALRLQGLPVPCACTRCNWERDPESVSAADARRVAAAALDAGRYGEAARAFARAVAQCPEDGDSAHSRGVALLNLGRFTAARRVWARYAALSDHKQLRQQAAQDAAFWRGSPAPASAVTEAWVPYRTAAGEDVAFESRRSVLTPEECEQIRCGAERVAAEAGGWTTVRHVTVPTTDIPAHEVPEALSLFNKAIAEKLAPALHSFFPALVPAAADVRVHDAFVVRYDARGGQTGLPTHTDQSQLSGIISLSPRDDYDGGGTRFELLPEGSAVVRPEQGHAALFRGGEFYHGGEPVTRGTRYIIACFFYVERAEDSESE